MASQIVPELISKKLIKPSSATPPDLRQYKLSLLDQLIPTNYIPIAFLYPNNVQNQQKCSPLILENSLSKILSSYYSLAGRLVDNISIDCNDKGATFIEAQFNIPMSEILREPQHLHNIVFPEGLPWKSITHVMEEDKSLLVTQLSHFECGAKALSFCMSHKIGDALSLCNFIRDWAALNHGEAYYDAHPRLDVASFLPPIEDPSRQLPLDGSFGSPHESLTTRNYTFNGSKLRALKARAAAETEIHNLTRVEIVTALLFKCAYKAVAEAESSGSFFQIANMRSFMDPLLSTCFGNLAQFFNFNLRSTISKDEPEVSLAGFVRELRRSKIQFHEKFDGITTKELQMEIHDFAENTNKDAIINSYTCTSFCRFNLYNVDFGWGKPGIVRLAPGLHKNLVMLMDDKNGDGIEAMVTLPEEVMPIFESDPELFEFASSSSYV